ncbi:hypothetical protein [Paenibacillus sp. NRS-1760]|uniref:hypothetical protein n=1 Tax=Paenibacillus sp. NRS-1760 TaxID=3233902 RepID=UPI003D2DA0AB
MKLLWKVILVIIALLLSIMMAFGDAMLFGMLFKTRRERRTKGLDQRLFDWAVMQMPNKTLKFWKWNS